MKITIETENLTATTTDFDMARTILELLASSGNIKPDGDEQPCVVSEKLTPNQYLTITENDITLGGSSVCHYHEQRITVAPDMFNRFRGIKAKLKRERGVELLKMHVVQASNYDGWGEAGTPIYNANGTAIWARIMYKTKDGKKKLSAWRSIRDFTFAYEASRDGVYDLILNMHGDSNLRRDFVSSNQK